MSNMAAILAGKYISRFFSATLTSASHVKFNFISISAAMAGGQKWRISNGLAGDGLAYGPLTDLPDWTFVDGESAPESKRRRKRQNKRLKESQRIMQYLKQVDKNERSDSQDKM
ncbi:Hypothetical predicted protein [Paramuricea clavata]|uniref:Large ribosomal subunit protein mL52 n=1 Tax=Paramuricea clavata TaxID=317549 RepID=A0A6S7KNA6_PARCT|nr:Hypothetical predicted protein [Paramuricea clavata]